MMTKMKFTYLREYLPTGNVEKCDYIGTELEFYRAIAEWNRSARLFLRIWRYEAMA